MKLRVVPALLATALGLGSLLVASPAVAVPAAPGISALDTSTTGHVSGTVTSAEPYVFVAVVSTSDAGEPTRTKLTMSSSSSFSLPTWGYGADAAVRAWACPTGTFSAPDCSAATTSSFTPTDLVPEVTWFDDIYIGPADPNPTITVSDPGGGGVLKASYVHSYGYGVLDTVVTSGVPTNVIGDLDRTSGYVQLSRCSAPDLLHCTTFDPDLQKSVWVVRHISVGVIAPIPPMSSVSDSQFTLNAEFAGEAVVAWHLESAANPGAPIAGTEHTVNRTVDANGDMPVITIPRVNIPEGSYNVVGTIDLNNTDYYGMFEDAAFTAPMTVDRTGPAVTISANRVLIYPYVSGTASLPSYVIWTLTGAISDIGQVEVQKLDGTKVYDNFYVDDTSSTKATVTWNGKWADGKVRAGTYRFVVRDRNRNPVIAPKTVTVDARKLVGRTFIKTVTAGGSLKDQYVGRCSTLRKPSLRGWSYSLGLYANTKCSSQTSKDSVVNTIHSVRVPSAYSYTDVKVHTYGGAATANPHSPAVLQYLTVNGDLVSRQRLTPTLMNHYGEVRSAKNMIFSDHVFAWSVYTGFGYRYDLKSFTVVVHYKVLI